MFTVAFLLSLVLAVFSSISLLLFPRFSISTNTIQSYTIITILTSAVSYIISPFIVFIVFYFIGKSIDISAEYKSVIVALAIGDIIGYIVAYVPIQISYFSGNGAVFSSGGALALLAIATIAGTSVVSGATRVFESTFFVGLAALAIAYILRKKNAVNMSSTNSQHTQTSSQSAQPETSSKP